MKTDFIYYRYGETQEYPVFVRMSNADLEKSTSAVLTELGFKKVESTTFKQEELEGSWRVLDLDWATAKLAKKMMSSSIKEQTFGLENVSQNNGYQYYNYRGFFAMVFSQTIHLWEGRFFYSTFDDSTRYKLRTVLFRFLTFALAPLDIIGVWGVPVENGVVVMNQAEAKGEAIFVDLKRNKLLTIEGQKPINGFLELIRLDKTLNNSAKIMSSEELIAFLLSHTTHLSPSGINARTKSTVVALVDICYGLIYPEANYRPRVSLSY